MYGRPFLFVLAGLLLAPVPAQAQSQWQQQVLGQIRTASDVFGPEGYGLVGDTHMGSLHDETSEDFTVTLQAGVAYILVGVCDNDCPDIDLMLRDPGGNEVDSDYEEDAVPMLEVTPTSTQSYTVHVYMADCSSEPCFYGVGVFAQGALATPVVAGGATQSYQGRLEMGDARLDSKEYYDTYPFQGSAGDAVVVDLSSFEFDPYLILKSPSGERSENDDYEGSTSRSRIEEVLDESGEWSVLVTSFQASETGAYELSITTAAAGAVATAAAGGRTERGTLASGDSELASGEYYDSFDLSGSAGEYFIIDLRSRDFDPYLIFIAPSGEQFENDDHEGDATRSQVAMQLPEGGGYRVLVTSYKPGESGSYTLTIGRGGAVAAAAGPRVEHGALASGDQTLSSGEYADGYTFEGRPGQRVRLDVSSSEFDTYLMLIDPAGGQAENDDFEGLAGHSVIESDITEAGTHRVVVTSYKVGETGAYELSIEFGEGSPTTTRQRDVVALRVGEQTTGRLEAGDRQLMSGVYSDLYVFEGATGLAVSVEMSSTDFDTYLQLISPDGEQIENDDYQGQSNSRIDVNLREDGRYQILSTSYSAGETGEYRLTLSAATGAEVPVVTAGPLIASGESRIYGVFMGISDYPGEANDLSYTAEDAVRVHDAMVQTGMRRDDAIVLTDSEATVGNLHAAVREFSARMGPDDMFVLFYSGHGNRLPRSGGYEASDPDALDETIELYDGPLTDDEMGRMFENVGAGVSLVVLDACFSGGFAKDVISAPGRMGLFSSEEDVTSSVAAKFRAGGYLAVFLADAVGDGLADADQDGGVSALELSQYLHERYRADVKSASPGDYVRTGGPQLGYQHLVVDRGSIGPYDILFQLEGRGR
ncbi:MAG: caspase family protein [Gemmatimonadota bacterium]|nr:MAG: caspase family protein [Gemmatimonadota bacterium]